MSEIDTVRNALRVLRSHPESVLKAITILAQAGTVPHYAQGGWDLWKARADCLVLKGLNMQEVDGSHGVHDAINRRFALKQQIEKCQHNGKVRVVESGRDCDGVEYDGSVREIDATVAAFAHLEAETWKWADGPFRLAIVPWGEEIEYTSRDLVLEAFEDGHPHSITSRFP